MLNVGLIGLGPEWERRFRPALARLAPRLSVRCVHASILSRAEQAAAEIGCDLAHGLMSLMERDDVRALLILDTEWYGAVPAQLACQVGKPAFLATRLAHGSHDADRLVRQAAQTGVTLMPDLAHRYTPATARLRELMATRLGRPLSLAVDVVAHGNSFLGKSEMPDACREALAVAVDWSTTLAGAPPVSVRAVRNCADERLELHVEFRRPPAQSAAPSALVRLAAEVPGPSHDSPSNNGCDTSITLRAKVECARGSALLDGPQEITWNLNATESTGEPTEETAGERIVESLASDRPGLEVMLDHFCRRVVGGLIPVPTLDDLCRAFQYVDAALRTI